MKVSDENRKGKILDIRNIDFKIVYLEIFCSIFFWVLVISLYNQFTYSNVEIEETAATFFTELKIVGVPEPMKLVEYDFEKGIRRKSKSRIHLKFNYTLPKEEVMEYYKKNLMGNDWELREEEENMWKYEKENLRITMRYLPDGMWKLDINYIDEFRKPYDEKK